MWQQQKPSAPLLTQAYELCVGVLAALVITLGQVGEMKNKVISTIRVA